MHVYVWKLACRYANTPTHPEINETFIVRTYRYVSLCRIRHCLVGHLDKEILRPCIYIYSMTPWFSQVSTHWHAVTNMVTYSISVQFVTAPPAYIFYWIEAIQYAATNAWRPIHNCLPLSTAKYSFSQLSEPRQCGVNKFAKGLTQQPQDANPGSLNRESEGLATEHLRHYQTQLLNTCERIMCAQ